jgi:hypothetical protein
LNELQKNATVVGVAQDALHKSSAHPSISLDLKRCDANQALVCIQELIEIVAVDRRAAIEI